MTFIFFSENNANEELNNAVVYEACRIFKDKLINAEHKLRFDQILTEVFGSKTGGMQIRNNKKPMKLLNVFRPNLRDQFGAIQSHQLRWETPDTDQ